jgi:exopolysaccharide biosynthesis polyprenyl glycosylphosphotransferase
MYREQAFIIIRLLIFLDALFVILAAYGGYYLRVLIQGTPPKLDENLFALSVLVVMVVNNYAANKLGLYSDKKLKSYLNLIWKILKCVVLDFIVLGCVIFILKERTYSRAFTLYFASLLFILLACYRLVIYTYVNNKAINRFGTKKILVVGGLKRAEKVIRAVESQVSWGINIVNPVTVCQKIPVNCENGAALSSDFINELPGIMAQGEIDEVIFAVGADDSVDLKVYINLARKMGIEARIVPALWDLSSDSVGVEEFQGIPFLTIRDNKFNAAGLLYKRALDIAGGLVGSLVFLAMYPIVAIAIKLDSPGPVLFKQERIGKNGRVFQLFKFRSMYQDAEERKKELMAQNEMDGLMFKVEKDPRVTRIGRFLRNTSIDEFPQFVNVLKGEMSLVGTRPPTPDEVEHYSHSHRRRISAKPGITGLWQISGRNKITDFEKVVELDCKYLESWRFWNDIRILFKTVFVVLRRKGAF